MDHRRDLGASGERHAARALEANGLFVEVKARRPGWDDAPGAAVSWLKRRRLVQLAQRYIKARGLGEVPCRFDVVEVTDGGRGSPTVRHLRSAFDA